MNIQKIKLCFTSGLLLSILSVFLVSSISARSAFFYEKDDFLDRLTEISDKAPKVKSEFEVEKTLKYKFRYYKSKYEQADRQSKGQVTPLEYLKGWRIGYEFIEYKNSEKIRNFFGPYFSGSIEKAILRLKNIPREINIVAPLITVDEKGRNAAKVILSTVDLYEHWNWQKPWVDVVKNNYHYNAVQRDNKVEISFANGVLNIVRNSSGRLFGEFKGKDTSLIKESYIVFTQSIDIDRSWDDLAARAEARNYWDVWDGIDDWYEEEFYKAEKLNISKDKIFKERLRRIKSAEAALSKKAKEFVESYKTNSVTNFACDPSWR